MHRNLRLIFVAAVCLTVATCVTPGQTVEFAKDLYRHRLIDKATEVFLTSLHNSSSTPLTRAQALYWLGQISFDEGRLSVAFDDWQQLVKTYPQSPEGKEISARLTQLTEIVGKVSDATISSATAQSYISNGDFWSKGNDRIFIIDSSWLPEVELSIDWYDRVIKEFPESGAAEIAYQRKLFTLLGWKDIGRDGNVYGVKSDFDKYMPAVLQTFSEFEKAYPSNPYLQGFRYQIAQAYWRTKQWSKTKEWLQKIIEEGKGQSTFYTETAKARLKKVEY